MYGRHPVTTESTPATANGTLDGLRLQQSDRPPFRSGCEVGGGTLGRAFPGTPVLLDLLDSVVAAVARGWPRCWD
jgi:hypothetical protein